MPRQKKEMTEEDMPKVGDQVEYWRRDVGGPSERITAIVLETIGISWCVIRRDDTGEERQIEPQRLRVVALAKEENGK